MFADDHNGLRDAYFLIWRLKRFRNRLYYIIFIYHKKRQKMYKMIVLRLID